MTIEQFNDAMQLARDMIERVDEGGVASDMLDVDREVSDQQLIGIARALVEFDAMPVAKAPVGVDAEKLEATLSAARGSQPFEIVNAGPPFADAKLEALHAAWRDMPSSISTSDPGFGAHFQRMLNAVTDLVATPDELAAVKLSLAKEPTDG